MAIVMFALESTLPIQLDPPDSPLEPGRSVVAIARLHPMVNGHYAKLDLSITFVKPFRHSEDGEKFERYHMVEAIIERSDVATFPAIQPVILSINLGGLGSLAQLPEDKAIRRRFAEAMTLI